MKIIGLGGATLASFGWFNAVSTPLLGVPLTVVGMAVLGVFLSYATDDPENNRKKMYFTAIQNIFIAILFVAIIPRALGWEWVSVTIEAPLAGALAFFAKWWLPAITQALPKLIPEVLRKIFRLDNESKK